MSALHCCSGGDCSCETEAEAHASCDCTMTRDDCDNPDCCTFCHGRWDEYVS